MITPVAGRRYEIQDTRKVGGVPTTVRFVADVTWAEAEAIDLRGRRGVYFGYVPLRPEHHGAWGCAWAYETPYPFGLSLVADLGEIPLRFGAR